MFLRPCEPRKNGKRHTYWAAVESYRTARGSRQRVVAQLGELKRSEPSGWAQLGPSLSGKKKPGRSLFDPPHYDEPSEDQTVLVRLKGVKLERVRDFGDVWMAWGLGRLLALDSLLAELIPRGQEQVPWATMAAILVIARFCQPQSELDIESTWYRGSAWDDLLGVSPEKVHTDRLYTALDVLLPHKEAIEKHLKDRLGNLFELEYELLLYDLTSRYLEGECRANPMAKRGYSRDKRPDCLQVTIGLVVTEEAIPLGYEVFAGNPTDVTTVEEIVEAMERKYGRAKRVWVMDRGMVSEDNLKLLGSRQGQQIVGTPKARLRQFEKHLLDKQWKEVQEGIELKLVPGPEGDETLVLAHILVCFLASVLWKTLAGWMRRSGLGDAPRTLIEELADIKSGGVVLPAEPRGGRPAGRVRLGCVSGPDAAQKVLLHRLGIQLPGRLRHLEDPVPM